MIYEDYVSTLSPTEVSKVFCALDCCILKTAKENNNNETGLVVNLLQSN